MQELLTLLNKHKMDKDIPFIFPSCTTYQYHFSNNSEKNCYSKMITD